MYIRKSLEKCQLPWLDTGTKEASELQRRITQKLQSLMFTNNKIVPQYFIRNRFDGRGYQSVTLKKAIVFP